MSWLKAPLGQLVDVLSGTTPDTGDPSYWGGSHIWVTPTDLGRLNDHLISDSSRTLTDEGRASRGLTKIPEGSVVMSSRAPIGHLAIAGCDLYTNQGCKNFVCNDAIDAWFLYFNLMYRMSDIQMMGSGATFVEVSKSAIENFEISYPVCVEQQRQIVNQLKAQLAEVEKARKAAQAQADDIRLLRERLLEDARHALDGVPVKVLGDHAPTTSGTTPSRGNKSYWAPAEIPWVKTGEVAFAPITQTEEAVSRKALAECSLMLLPPKTVLAAMYGQGKTRGQSAVLEVQATTNQACFAILPNDTWTPEFLYLWLMVNYQYLRQRSDGRGGNQANLNGAILKALELPAPSLKEQNEWVQRIRSALTEVDAMQAANQATLQELTRLPQRLLAQVFDDREET